MKKIKKYLSIYLSIFIIFCSIPIFRVNATVTQNVFTSSTQSVGGVNLLSFEYDDPSLLPDNKMVYWVEDSAVVRAPINDIFTVLMNKKFGLAIKPNFLSNYLSFLNMNLWGSGSELLRFFNGSAGFVFKNNTVVGVALDNLENYSLKSDNNYTNLNVPSVIVNNTWNYWNNYIDRNPQATPYFIVEPLKPYYFDVSPTYNDEYESIIDRKVRSLTNNQVLLCAKDQIVNENNSSYTYNILSSPNSQWGTSSCKIFDNINSKIAVHNTSITQDNSTWVDFCNNFGLNENKTTLTYFQLSTQTSANLFINFYNSSDLTKDNSSISFQQNGNTSTSSSSPSLTHLGSYPVGETSFTVYKDIASVNDITNNTYQKNYYISTTTNNFNTNNDNTTIINKEQINNSQSTNNNIYNQSQSTTNNNNTENNYNIDNSQNDNSVTTIINNYYNSGDSGNNGGGGSGGDDDNNDSIWDALLSALGTFLKKIGELLATILTGIISIATSVIDAIANITTTFSGVTDFLSSVFSFLPTDLISIITLGVTLGVLISLIKMFGR